jgi:hypothetical protein
MPRYGSQFGPGLARDRDSQTETYRDAAGRHRTLRHRVVRGWHVVSVGYPFLEQPTPTVRRFRDIEDARQWWREMRATMKAEGYEKVTR